MPSISRRNFLRATALGGAAAVAGAPSAFAQNPDAPDGDKPNDPTAPGASEGWEVPESTLPADPADCPISNVGVLMMENRSYDTYFGWLENGRGFLNLGLELSYTDPADPSVTASPQHWAPRYRRTHPHPDPDHGWTGGRNQITQGFLAGRNTEYALAYYLAEDVPAYARLARQFTVFDRYFCSVMGPTWPNRHYQHSAEGGGIRSNQLPPQEGALYGYTWDTIWDRLDDAGLTSAYYFSDLPFIAMYGPRHFSKMRPITQFFVDAALGRLPDVYFVDPSFLGDHRTDDHPHSSDMNPAQAFVNNVVHAVTHGPQWPSQALFVNYDEWGGFFDHVVPPRVPDDRASDDLFDDWSQLGFRLPVMAVSPYSRKGYVHHDGPYDHTAILKFISWRWDLEPLNTRHLHAPNIGEAFDYTQDPRLNIGIRQMEAGAYLSSNLDFRDSEHDEAGSSLEAVPLPPDDFSVLAEHFSSLGLAIPSLTPSELLGLPSAIPALAAATVNGALTLP